MADPYADFSSPTQAADPYAAIATPASQMSAGTKAARIVGQGAQGFNDAVANAAGVPGDIINWAENKLTKGLGLPGRPKAAGTPLLTSEGLKEAGDYVATLPGRVSDAVSHGSFTPLTDSRTSRFEAQGTAEKSAHGVGSGVGNVLSLLLPAGILADAAPVGSLTQGVARALSSQPVIQIASGAAQGGVGEGTGNPWLGMAAGAAVPVGAAAAQRAITPVTNALTPQERTIIQTADREGIPLTPAQRTGSRTLRILEEKGAKLPGSASPMGEMFAEQRQQFNRAALERAGVTATDASTATMDAAFQRAGQTFDDLARRTVVNADPQFVADVQRVATDYGRRLPTDTARVFQSYMDDLDPLMQAAQSGSNPQIAGDIYARIRSGISQTIRESQNDKPLQRALGGIVDALDGAMERSTSGPLRQEWQDARRQYQALMTIDRAAGAGTQATRAAGDIPYAGLTNAVRSSDRAGFARGRGQLNALSRVGDYIAQRTPDSGTPAGEAILNPLKWPMLAGLNVAGRLYGTSPVQAYLTNQAVTNRTSIPNALAAQAARQLLNSNEATAARGGR